MLTEKRRRVILELLEREETVGLQEFMKALDASESTVRRDLSQLEDEGMLIRIHGGAKRIYTIDFETPIQEKVLQSLREKEVIGHYAAMLVERQEIIYMDAGSTTMQMIPYLAGKEVTVVTNGIQQATMLLEQGIKTIVLGGILKPGTRAIIGQNAMQQLQQYRFEKIFLGMNGVDWTYGYTTPDEEEAAIKRLAMQQSNHVYILADDSKISKVSFCKVADLEDATLITNATPEQQEVRLRQKTSVLITKAYE